MKKIVFTLIASMVMTAALADTPKTTTANNANAANYDMTVNYNRLAVALNLDGDQIESVKLIHGDYIKAMNAAAKAPEAEKKEMVRKATQKELATLFSYGGCPQVLPMTAACLCIPIPSILLPCRRQPARRVRQERFQCNSVGDPKKKH